MTTQLPYQPQQPPPPAYPTAPPWATPPTPAAAAPDQAPPWQQGEQALPHGGLLVPFPEEMQHAARPQPPAWWPVLIWTFFFSILALISVVKRANMAHRGRNSAAPYWIAWGVMMVVSSVFGIAVNAVAVPAYLNYREGAITKQVQGNIVGDGSLTTTMAVKATSANCAPVGPRDIGGERAYDCVLQLDDGRTGTLVVIADGEGTWSAVPVGKKK